jgi:predicted porin
MVGRNRWRHRRDRWEQDTHFGGGRNGGFAFQVGAGVDYYFSPKWSTFVEYKFLDYTNAGGDFNNSNIGQHLVGGGVKFHF